MDFQDLTGRARRTGTDTEHERTAVGPGMMAKTSGGANDFTNQMAGLFCDDVMARAVADKLKGDASGASGEALDGFGFLEPQTADAAARDEERAAEEDDDLDALRARLLEEKKRAFAEQKELSAKGHGTYEEIVEEEFLPTVTKSHLAVVHFYHRHFERSKVMDMHVARMAKRFFKTRFVKLDAEKAPFFVEKLTIRTLPCVAVFIDGVLIYKQLGFDGLGGGKNDDFKTGHLCRLLRETGVLAEDFDSEGEI